MRRRILVTALALVGVFAVAGVAYAVNIYTLDAASTTPAGKGSASKPVAKKVVFAFSTNTSDGSRAEVIQFFDIGFQGLQYFGKGMPKCTFAEASQKSLAAVQTACRRAAVGAGTVNNFFGSSSDKSAKTACKLQLRLYNTGTGLALRVDRGATADCLIDPSTAINAKFRNTRIGGVRSVNLKFEVGNNLRHPIPGFDNSINNVTSTVLRKLTTVRIAGVSRRVGLLSSRGCGRRRTISVKFTDEKGVSSTVRKTAKC